MGTLAPGVPEGTPKVKSSPEAADGVRSHNGGSRKKGGTAAVVGGDPGVIVAVVNVRGASVVLPVGE
jgi:hypothetical protein